MAYPQDVSWNSSAGDLLAGVVEEQLKLKLK
jgi:hypothetical protein